MTFRTRVVPASTAGVSGGTGSPCSSTDAVLLAGYMVFYSLGSALGAAATTAVFAAYGWAGVSLLGAAFATCAAAVRAVGVFASARHRQARKADGLVGFRGRRDRHRYDNNRT